ncbi:MAG: MFS transporter, partial [Patescibacteria group bacterium]
QYLLTTAHTRSRYFGRLNFWLNIALASGPILGGLIIRLFSLVSEPIYGYMTLFLLVAVIDFYILLLAFRLPRHVGISFSFVDILQHKRSISWKIVLVQQFIFGLWDVAFAAFSGVLIFLIVKQELYVGGVKTVSALIFAVGSIVAGKILQRYKFMILPAAYLSTLGLLLFGLFQNWWGIVAFLLLPSLVQPFVNVATSKSIYDVMDESKESWQNKYHYLIERDSVLGLARILNYVILLFIFTPENQITVAKTWILIIPLFPLLIGTLQWLQYRNSKIHEVSS